MFKHVFYHSIAVALFAAAIVLFCSNGALAHESESGTDVMATVHVDPNDHPVASSATTIYYAIKSDEGLISDQNCTCVVQIIKDGKELYGGDMFATKPVQPGEGRVHYTFESAGSYTVRLVGAPKGEGAFESFSLSFPETVAAAANVDTKHSYVITYGIVAIAVVLFFGIVAFFYYERPGNRMRTKQPKQD